MDTASTASDDVPWGEPFDGLACRLVVQPRYAVGQAIDAVVEVKNTSKKTRYFVPNLDPSVIEFLTFELAGPKGKVEQTYLNRTKQQYIHEHQFQPIGPGEVKRFAMIDLRDYYLALNESWPGAPSGSIGKVVVPGKYTLLARFRSPKVPSRFVVGWSNENGKQITKYKDVPAEVTAGQWAGELSVAPVTFELAPLAKEDFVVHEWGVFTVFNDAEFANIDRKDEWGNLPSFFYRQFPKERLRWVPSAWDKPVIYFYAKPSPIRLSVKVTFANQGVPVVWWPAVADPVDDRVDQSRADPQKPRPFRTLTWRAWLGDRDPQWNSPSGKAKVQDFELPDDCWLRHARLPSASRLTVVGNIEGPAQSWDPDAKDRYETERFIYYDGLVPAADSLRCEHVDDTSVTLRNRATFDLGPLFIIDRRATANVRFAAVKGPMKAGSHIKVEPRPIPVGEWPATGNKAVRKALLDAGLFPAEADAILAIWQKRLLQAEGITAFYLLPGSEYDRMLPLDILPVPAEKPVRVGIALHPHMEIEPELAGRVVALIRQLGDANFANRDAASKMLLEIGPMAIALLRAELQAEPPLEMRRRIDAILDRVDASVWLSLSQKETKPASNRKR